MLTEDGYRLLKQTILLHWLLIAVYLYYINSFIFGKFWLLL